MRDNLVKCPRRRHDVVSELDGKIRSLNGVKLNAGCYISSVLLPNPSLADFPRQLRIY